MPIYSVQIPVTGSIIVTLDADTPEEAKAAAWNKASFRITCDDEDAEAGDFESHERTCYGNVCSASCREVNVEEV